MRLLDAGADKTLEDKYGDLPLNCCRLGDTSKSSQRKVTEGARSLLAATKSAATRATVVEPPVQLADRSINCMSLPVTATLKRCRATAPAACQRHQSPASTHALWPPLPLKSRYRLPTSAMTQTCADVRYANLAHPRPNPPRPTCW